MGTSVGGIGTSGARAALPGIRTAKKQPTKRLNYNYREISGQILQAKKAQSASTVLVRAKSKVAALARSGASGQYDAKEVAAAVAHAKRMVRCAQMKVRNLREEERDQAAHHDEGNTRARQKKGEFKRRAAQKEQELERKVQIEVTQEIQIEKRKRQEMMQKRSMHRMRERGKITEADMKYLKALGDEGKIPYTDGTGIDAGVVFSLSAESAALALAEAEIRAQVEQELSAQIGAEAVSVDAGTASVPGMGVAAGIAGVAAGVAAAAIDVSV